MENNNCLINTQGIVNWAKSRFAKNPRRSLSGAFKYIRRNNKSFDLVGDWLVLSSIIQGSSESGVIFNDEQIRLAVRYTDVLDELGKVAFTKTHLRSLRESETGR